MGADSKIEWTDHTFNPWIGCTKVSPGCDHCYAETLAKRTGHDVWGPGKPRRYFGEKHWAEPFKWDAAAAKAGVRRRVFCASMADVFDNEIPHEERGGLFDTIEATPNIDWLLLTKRIGNVLKSDWRDEPRDNVWLGISIVNQEEADRDIPKLLAVPARVRFLSCEPLLGPIDLKRWMGNLPWDSELNLDWVIVGGESGGAARPMNPQWARDLRDQCADCNIPFFFKQWGEYVSVSEVEGPGAHHKFPDGRTVRRLGKKRAGRMLDGREWNQFPVSP